MGLIDRCGKRPSSNPETVCNRPEGHYGLHRDKVMKNHSSFSWGDNECYDAERQARVQAELLTIARDAGLMPTPAGSFTVKLWYWSGAFEQIPGVDQENAYGYLAEAQANGKVQVAEIHSGDGSLTAGFRHDGTRALDSADTAG